MRAALPVPPFPPHPGPQTSNTARTHDLECSLSITAEWTKCSVRFLTALSIVRFCDLELDHSWLSCRSEHLQLSSSSWATAAVGTGSWLHGQATRLSAGWWQPSGWLGKLGKASEELAGAGRGCSISALEQVSHCSAALCRGHRGAGAGAKDRLFLVGKEGTWCFLWVGDT